jgi:hypothetical protein
MASKHMNLKRISHRIKEEVGSTMEVANVVGIRGAFATFRGKVDIQIMVHNGHIEHVLEGPVPENSVVLSLQGSEGRNLYPGSVRLQEKSAESFGSG